MFLTTSQALDGSCRVLPSRSVSSQKIPQCFSEMSQIFLAIPTTPGHSFSRTLYPLSGMRDKRFLDVGILVLGPGDVIFQQASLLLEEFQIFSQHFLLGFQSRLKQTPWVNERPEFY